MTMATRPWLLAACAAAVIGCSGGDDATQVVTGKVTTAGAIAVRAVDGTDVITASRVHSDGSFTLALPAGHQYRLELLTTSGVRPVLARSGSALTNLQFKVCHPTQPFNCGGIGGNHTPNGMGGGNGMNG